MEQIFSTTSFTVNQLIEKIDTGELGLPELQRPFVWQNVKVRDLFDSMLSGYPVGYLMLWKCPELDKKKTIGSELRDRDAPKEVIIDGQQRLTSLYAVMKNKKVIDASYKERNIVISFCPLSNKFEVGGTFSKNSPEWIYNVSDLFMRSSSYSFISQFIYELSDACKADHKVLTDREKETISINIEAVYNLRDYSFQVFSIKSNADEEAVSQIFVRINSEGTKLTENDFILTLLSVHWGDGRAIIERFCRESILPPVNGITSYNSIGIKIQPKNIIRTVMAYAFNKGQLHSAYRLLRGVEFERQGVVSREVMDKNFAIIKEKMPDVMNLNNLHEFFRAVMDAGYLSENMILSKNGIYFVYAMYLIAKYRFGASNEVNRSLTSLWFFCSALTSMYGGVGNNVAEVHFNMIRISEYLKNIYSS